MSRNRHGFRSRTKYAHVIFPLDEKSLRDDYLALQENMVLIILKTNKEIHLIRVVFRDALVFVPTVFAIAIQTVMSCLTRISKFRRACFREKGRRNKQISVCQLDKSNLSKMQSNGREQ